MSTFGKIALIVAVVACVAVTLTVGIGVVRYFADRSPAVIHDIPIYPGAGILEYSDAPDQQSPDFTDCSRVAFTAVSDQARIQDYYKSTLIHDRNLLKRDWVGDGIFYPDINPVRFYRKASGGMQVLEVGTSSATSQTLVTIWLCKMP
jgi:hypothetical protein